MFHMLVTRWALRAEVSIKNEFLTHKSSTATFKNHEKGNTMTTCALGCSKNGLLRFFLIMTDSALNDKENFIVRCRMLSALFKKRRIETYA